MRVNISRLLLVCGLGVLFTFLSGCLSTRPSSFYQLSEMNSRPVAQDTSSEGSMVVVIGPVRIPDYLDRSQIVTRSGKNGLMLAESDRWAGSVESDLARVLVGDIRAQLPPELLFVMRWAPLLESHVTSSYRVEIIVNRFEGELDGAVNLNTQWGIFAKDKGLLFRKESTAVEQVTGKGYGAYVEAMSRAVERLSKEIADGIVATAAKRNPL